MAPVAIIRHSENTGTTFMVVSGQAKSLKMAYMALTGQAESSRATFVVETGQTRNSQGRTNAGLSSTT